MRHGAAVLRHFPRRRQRVADYEIAGGAALPLVEVGGIAYLLAYALGYDHEIRLPRKVCARPVPCALAFGVDVDPIVVRLGIVLVDPREGNLDAPLIETAQRTGHRTLVGSIRRLPPEVELVDICFVDGSGNGSGAAPLGELALDRHFREFHHRYCAEKRHIGVDNRTFERYAPHVDVGTVYVAENIDVLRAVAERKHYRESVAVAPAEEPVFGHILERKAIFQHGLLAVDIYVHYLRFDLGVTLFIMRA